VRTATPDGRTIGVVRDQNFLKRSSDSTTPEPLLRFIVVPNLGGQSVPELAGDGSKRRRYTCIPTMARSTSVDVSSEDWATYT